MIRTKWQWLEHFLGPEVHPLARILFAWLWDNPEELQKVPPAFRACAHGDDLLYREMAVDWGTKLRLSPEEASSFDWRYRCIFIAGGVIAAMTAERLVDPTLVMPRA